MPVASKSRDKRLRSYTPHEWRLMEEAKLGNNKDSDFIKVPWDFFKPQPELFDYVSRHTQPSTVPEFKAFLILQWKFSYVVNTTDMEQDEMDSYTSLIADFKEMGLPRRVMETKYAVELQYALREAEQYKQFLRLPMKAFDKSRGKLGMFVEAVLNTLHVETFDALWRITWNKLGFDAFDIDNLRRYWKTVVLVRRKELEEARSSRVKLILAKIEENKVSSK